MASWAWCTGKPIPDLLIELWEGEVTDVTLLCGLYRELERNWDAGAEDVVNKMKPRASAGSELSTQERSNGPGSQAGMVSDGGFAPSCLLNYAESSFTPQLN